MHFLIIEGVVTLSHSTFGQGTGPIFLSNLRCDGTEQRLTDCISTSGASCSHYEDAGVRCQQRTGMGSYAGVVVLLSCCICRLCSWRHQTGSDKQPSRRACGSVL